MARIAETPHTTATTTIAPHFVIAKKSHFALIGATRVMREPAMKIMSAREAKNGFGLLIDTARAAPVLVEKHGRGVVVVLAVEEYERLRRLDCQSASIEAVPD